MEKIDLINIIYFCLTIWLILLPQKKNNSALIFFAGVLLFGLGIWFALIDYTFVAEVYFRLSLICLLIGTIRTCLRFRDG